VNLKDKIIQYRNTDNDELQRDIETDIFRLLGKPISSVANNVANKFKRPDLSRDLSQESYFFLLEWLDYKWDTSQSSGFEKIFCRSLYFKLLSLAVKFIGKEVSLSFGAEPEPSLFIVQQIPSLRSIFSHLLLSTKVSFGHLSEERQAYIAYAILVGQRTDPQVKEKVRSYGIDQEYFRDQSLKLWKELEHWVLN
jgi:hypothetical protein